LEKEEKINDIAILGIMIGETDYLGKGIGKKAIELAIRQSRGKFNFSKVCLNVRKTNTRAIRCYTKCGFCINGEGEKIVRGGQKIEFFHMALDLDKLQS
jgi:RimJ/RimL family protein N-acetyltransferase